MKLPKYLTKKITVQLNMPIALMIALGASVTMMFILIGFVAEMTTPRMPVTETTSTQPHQAFLGTLPCADCEGLKTELVLFGDAGATQGTYELHETYVGRSAQPYNTKGTWVKLVGTKQQPKATIYKLTPADGGSSQSYRLVDIDHLRLLDVNQQEIKGTSLNFTLTREK